jgi:SAM-dependent methyltransferase
MKNLIDKRMRGIDIDSKERISAHKEILKSKKMIRDVFIEFHNAFNDLDNLYLKGSGKRLEIGAGSCPIKNSYPDVLSSDIMPGEDIDLVIDASNINLPENSLHAIFAQNVFHHLPDPDSFFLELQRTLTPGGGAILIEPYYGFVASFLFKRISKFEHFDKTQKEWGSKENSPMSGANQALSYIVFIRDREKFTKSYRNLEIAFTAPMNNYLRYLLSGGLNFIQLVPNYFIPPLKCLEKILTPFNKFLALHYVIVIRKKIAHDC